MHMQSLTDCLPLFSSGFIVVLGKAQAIGIEREREREKDGERERPTATITQKHETNRQK